MELLRGKRIEEHSTDELFRLHKQIEDELPQDIQDLHKDPGHLVRLEELEAIEDELERRNERL